MTDMNIIKTKYIIDARLVSPDSEITKFSEEFMNRYSEYRRGERTVYLFDDINSANNALNELLSNDLRGKLSYYFEINDDEILYYPAFYFGCDMEFNLFQGEKADSAIIQNYDLVEDYESNILLVSPRAKKILESEVFGAKWSLIETTKGELFFSLEINKILPESIIIPAPVEVEELEMFPGFYSIRSDGREVITQANLNDLKTVGIAKSSEANIGDKTVKWVPQPIITTGAIIHKIRSNKLKGFAEHSIPLLMESHPLSR